ncbi:MAG: GWxTD domain-containing protein [Bacteroidetes bacterium]|nr:MAG: GWxTD domain-containing protein [Bacteroidota bacterium]
MWSRLLVPVLLVAASQLAAQDASIAFARFQDGDQAYVELAIHLVGRSLTPIPVTDSTYRAAADVLVLFEQGDQIAKYDKFRLNSPVGRQIVDFVDLKRYGLPPGEYRLKVEVTDTHDSTRRRSYYTDLPIDAPANAIQQSDIQLLASIAPAQEGDPLEKGGVRMEPLPYNFYGRGANTLAFYHEVYGSDLAIGVPFVASFRVQKLENGQATDMLLAHKRQEPAARNPILAQMDISSLPSGNYQLAVEIRDRERNLISSRKVLFQRSNPSLDVAKVEEAIAQLDMETVFVSKLDSAELEYSIRAISAIAPQQDAEVINMMLAEENLDAQRMYLYSFWLREDRVQPEVMYEQYMEVARAVDDMYQSGFRHGFETDRGYIYLKYGRPDDIVRNETEPSAPPYEIWSYNTIKRTNQNNVRFIFYNPSLAADDFILLHSDVIGERQNPQWQMELYRDSPNEFPQDYFMGTEVQDNMGRQSRQLLNDY